MKHIKETHKRGKTTSCYKFTEGAYFILKVPLTDWYPSGGRGGGVLYTAATVVGPWARSLKHLLSTCRWRRSLRRSPVVIASGDESTSRPITGGARIVGTRQEGPGRARPVARRGRSLGRRVRPTLIHGGRAMMSRRAARPSIDNSTQSGGKMSERRVSLRRGHLAPPTSAHAV